MNLIKTPQTKLNTMHVNCDCISLTEGRSNISFYLILKYI